MEEEIIKQGPKGGPVGQRSYALAALLIWGAVAFGLWVQALPPSPPHPTAMLLSLQPVSNPACDPS